jgi:Zn-dependent peptidase ImmA (M78 family)
MADKAYINPNILKWARDSARIPLDIAAAKVSILPEKLREWEEGSSQPTIKQAETLAKAYKRPFALFFLPEIPRDFLPLQDFRKQTAIPLGTASIFIIREMQQKHAWISEVAEDDNGQPLAFVGKFSINDNPQEVAKDILNTLGIIPGNYKGNPIKEWIDKAESKGIFISRTSFIHTRLKLDSSELQGFAIADKYAPFVFINTDDWDAPQLFTLVHELAHIWIAATGISSEVESDIKDFHPVELFCNEVAASALMPISLMQSLDIDVFVSASDVFKTARKIAVSSFALLFRAYNLQLLSGTKYNILRQAAENEFQAFLKREEEKKAKQDEKTGGPNPYLLRLNKNGRLFTQIVLDAFRGGRIAPTQASDLLNTQVNNFSKLEAFLYS